MYAYISAHTRTNVTCPPLRKVSFSSTSNLHDASAPRDARVERSLSPSGATRCNGRRIIEKSAVPGLFAAVCTFFPPFQVSHCIWRIQWWADSPLRLEIWVLAGKSAVFDLLAADYIFFSLASQSLHRFSDFEFGSELSLVRLLHLVNVAVD